MGAPRRLATISELREKRTLRFTYKQEGIPREGFLAWFRGKIVCYENVCRHLPVTLDYGDGNFFTPGGDHFICQTHGATYEPLTGHCIAGPCTGASLKPLNIGITGEEIWFEDPD